MSRPMLHAPTLTGAIKRLTLIALGVMVASACKPNAPAPETSGASRAPASGADGARASSDAGRADTPSAPTPQAAQDAQDPQASDEPASPHLLLWEATSSSDDRPGDEVTLHGALLRLEPDQAAQPIAQGKGLALLAHEDKVWALSLRTSSLDVIGCPDDCDPSDEPCMERWRKKAKPGKTPLYSLRLTPLLPHEDAKPKELRLTSPPAKRHEGSYVERVAPLGHAGSWVFAQALSDLFYCFTANNEVKTSQQIVELGTGQAAALDRIELATLQVQLGPQAEALGVQQHGQEFKGTALTLTSYAPTYDEQGQLLARYTFEGDCGEVCSGMVDESVQVRYEVTSTTLPKALQAVGPAPKAALERWLTAPKGQVLVGRGWSTIALTPAQAQALARRLEAKP